jgi:hypothetical protein
MLGNGYRLGNRNGYSVRTFRGHIRGLTLGNLGHWFGGGFNPFRVVGMAFRLHVM